jgi:ABC-type phosphate transport system permease subunit
MSHTREDTLQGMANQVEHLQGVISGLSRVAEAIAAIPANERSKALRAVEDSYRQSALELGYSDSEARDWVTAIMFCSVVAPERPDTVREFRELR